MNSHELREAFLRFFEERGHRRMPGAPIVPPGDPTLLFTSAGMVQFKSYFMGQSRPPHPRLVTVQKCFRTTDIEEVGDTSHLTFFEMLGNFSVGDYFKAEIIPWAWEFYTQVLKLTPDRLWPAVYLDDDEAYDAWVKIGVPRERIKRYGEDYNYWFSGESGPCGPDSEIYYDFGEQFGCGPGCEPSHDCGRFLEIWNLVFMSFYCDGEERTPLPSRNVDTGAGLERNACVLLFESDGWDKNRLPSVYDTDLFLPIIREIEHLYSVRYGDSASRDRSIRIIAEHTRAACFLIADGITPSNEGRGYVLRRMLRRAIYHAHSLIGNVNYLDMLASEVVEAMYRAYPELRENAGAIARWIRDEEARFTETLGRGRIAIKAIADLNAYLKGFFDLVPLGRWAAQETRLEDLWHSTELPNPVKVAVFRPFNEMLGAEPWLASREAIARAKTTDMKITGEAEFILWDTYGFPRELTREIAESEGLRVDDAADREFQSLMEAQQRQSRSDSVLRAEAAKATASALPADLVAENAVRFTGYDELSTDTRVRALTVDVKPKAHGNVGAKAARKNAGEGEIAEAVLAETPFYPEGGGQVGDRGEIVGPIGRLVVEDTQRVAERLIVQRGRVVEGRISVGDEVTARVDAQHRADTMRNHTATHLLHAALRKVLGTHVRQAGSLVAPDHLRFDFTHTEAVTREQLVQVERLVNEKVRENLPVHTRQTTFQQAMDEGVLAFFGDKYGEEVRVVEVNTVVPRFSAELCGGTHCERTGDVGLIIITGESSIGSGMRRIEALSGRGAQEFVRQRLDEIEEALHRLGGARGVLLPRIDALISERDTLAKKVERMEKSLATAPAMDQIVDRAVDVDGIKVLVSQVDLPSIDALRYSADAVRRAMPSGVAVLGTVIDGLPKFVAMVSQDVIPKGPKAGEILKRVAAVAGGGAGGRPDMAQGGGTDPSKIDAALAIVPEVVRDMLSGDGASGDR